MFWSPPKRAPCPIKFDPGNNLHQSFIAALACLKAKQFYIEIPGVPRTEKFKQELALKAFEFKVKDFIPDQEAAKEIQADVEKQQKNKD